MVVFHHAIGSAILALAACGPIEPMSLEDRAYYDAQRHCRAVADIARERQEIEYKKANKGTFSGGYQQGVNEGRVLNRVRRIAYRECMEERGKWR